jgi:hypothetical protein
VIARAPRRMPARLRRMALRPAPTPGGAAPHEPSTGPPLARAEPPLRGPCRAARPDRTRRETNAPPRPRRCSQRSTETGSRRLRRRSPQPSPPTRSALSPRRAVQHVARMAQRPGLGSRSFGTAGASSNQTTDHPPVRLIATRPAGSDRPPSAPLDATALGVGQSGSPDVSPSAAAPDSVRSTRYASPQSRPWCRYPLPRRGTSEVPPTDAPTAQ